MSESLEEASLLKVLDGNVFSVLNPSLVFAWIKHILQWFHNWLFTQLIVFQEHVEIFKVALKNFSVFSENHNTHPEDSLHNFFVLLEFVILERVVAVDVLGLLKSSQQPHD